MAMTKKSNAAQKAWNILRLALLWSRKGGVFKRRLMLDLNLIPKYLKSLRQLTRRDSICHHHYGERELSFDKTPIFHVKMHRPSSLRFKMPHIPCLNPEVDFDYDFEIEGDHFGYGNDDEVRKSFLKGAGGEEEDEDDDDDDDGDEDYGCEAEEGIDVKAEEFIAKFYEQMKMQRQISYLQYNEMIGRASN